MQNLRALCLVISSLAVLTTAALAGTDVKNDRPAASAAANKQQQIVESVDIQGNRRLRDDDLLYYIKTRTGDIYSSAALEYDLKQLLALNFFDKTATRVFIEQGVRGGVNVIFEVRELPIIRDLTFEGSKAVPESDILKAFREQRAGISKESIYDPVKSRNAVRILRELLASKGYPNAKVEVKEEEVSATSVALTFVVDQGNRSRIINIEFEGNKVFKSSELRNALQLVKETGLISRFKGLDILDLKKLQYDLQKNVRSYMFSKGYFQARIGEPQVVGLGIKRTDIIPLIDLPLPLLSSKDDTLKIIVPVTEGKLFRVGELKVEGNSIFSEPQILGYVGLKKGEVADGKRLQDAVYEDLKKVYGSQGFVLYNAEFDPVFKDNPAKPDEGIVDITLTIDEGKQFSLRRLEFTGNTFTRDRVLRREFLINEGDIYNQQGLEISIARINQLQYFDPVDKDKDVETRTDEEQGDVDLIVKVKEKGRQQISFNGGAAGIGGTFFGLEYSTNNLLGRGEVLSFSAGVGNRQQSLQFTFQEPYFRDRPINVGFSIFGSRSQFFGEGTFLSQNQDLLNSASSQFGTLTASSANLFTQNSYGANVFATAPLSELYFKKRRFTQFTRVGLTYQFSATTIKDPAVNNSGDITQRVPIIYAQPNIITSQISASFAFDTRQPSPNGIDTLNGKSLSISLALAGLGGDVRTYQPTISYSQFIPVRNKKSKNPQVFAFRLQGGTIGSYAPSQKVRNANSLSFIGGVPAYSRYYLGSEYDVRGYDSRSVGPLAPFDTFIVARNVVAATNISGTPVAATNIAPGLLADIAALGTFTGASGANPRAFSSRYQFIGGDTQLLGNFEYRIPIFGPVTIAGFADVGSVFNLRKTGTQQINSEFLADDTFVGAGTLTGLGLLSNPELNTGLGAIYYQFNRVLTRSDFFNRCVSTPGCPTSLPSGVSQLYLRGDVQQNSLLRIDDSAFGKLSDFRSSVGMELRVQVPIVNVPFRLIYYYNPRGKFGVTQEAPGIFLPGKRNGVKFTVGRTF